MSNVENFADYLDSVPLPNSAADYERGGSAQDEPSEVQPLPPLDLINAASFEGARVPSRDWHVPELIPAREITMLSGDGGTGKSLLALQLAVSTVAGSEWVGSSPSPGRALFISAEDDTAELHRRLANIVRAQGLHFHALSDLTILSLAGKDAILAAPEKREGPLAPSPLFRQVKAAIEASRPALLILDTLADLFGGDEIKRPHARQFIGLLRGLALDFDLAIVLLSHPSLSGMATGAGTSGSTAWSNSVRSRLYLERPRVNEGEGDPDVRVLTTKKANYGRTGGERVLRWVEGVFVYDGAVRADKVQFDADADCAFLALLADFERQGRPVSPSPSTTFAPTVFAKLPSAKAFGKAHLTAAMERLFAANRIHVETTGRESRRRSHIVTGPAQESGE